ncbi:hypothetical protein V2J09_020275 [Rumex salicifolius]
MQLMCLADLEFDYINPYETATRVNRMILPEMFTQGALCFLYLITGHWVMCLVCIPYLYYNVRMYMDRQHLIDVTEIFNHLNWEKKKRLFKLGYHVLVLFFSLFWLIWTALEDDEYIVVGYKAISLFLDEYLKAQLNFVGMISDKILVLFRSVLYPISW